MTLTELSIKRPILIIVFFAVVGLLGIFAVGQLKYDLLPKINAPFITITAQYAGASPADIENTLTKKLEEAVASVSKIKRITSRSNDGYAVVMIEFVQDTDLDKALPEVQRAVNQILPELPAGVKPPTLDKYSLADLPILRIAATAQIPDEAFFELLKNQIKPRLAQIKGVGRIQLIGGTEREVKIQVNEQALKFHALSLPALVQALHQANWEVPIGELKNRENQLGLRLNGKFSQLKTLENLVIASKTDGSKILLKEVATIEDGSKEQLTLVRLNQQNAVGIAIQKQSNANAVEVAHQVRQVLKEIEQTYQTAQIRFEIAADSSAFTLKATETVFYDLLIAIGLVALVMLVFLHSLRNALIVMLAIPTSLVFSLIGMYVMDFSLNLMTLLAMSLVIGVLVDDSIVVLENIYRHLEMGKDKARAALEGRNEIGFSAVSITFVDVVVFFPLAFVPGITGGLVKEFALVIVVSTLASLLVCFTLTPMLASRFARLEHLRPTNLFNRLIIAIEWQIQQLTQGYVALLKKALKYRWVVYALSLGALVSSLSLVSDGYVGGEFVPATDKGEITVTIELPAGTKITETNQMAKKIETQLAKIPEVSRLFSTVGLANDAFFGEIIGENQIEIAVLLQDKTKRQASIAQMSQRIRNLILQEPGAKVKVSPVGLIGAEATPVQILISGADRAAIQQYGLQLQQLTKQIKGTDDVRLSAQSGKPELAIQVDRAQLAKLGLSLEAVTSALRIAITGNDELKIKQLQTEVPLRIQLESADRQSKDQLENLSLVNDKGAVVYLKQFASFEYTTATSALERRNKQPALVLFSKVIGKDVNAIGDEIKQIVAQNPPPAGVKISYEGDLEMADDSFLYLALALLAGITLVYLIMTALYNSFYYPFVVLFSIPVALTGALLALALTMKTLNVFSIFGVIMMLGLVAKNAILLVDRTNELKAQGRSVLYALLDAGQTRLRPILMTTLAMVIGMLPLAMQQGAGGEYNSALAWVLIGGLTSSMCFTVFLVPAIYLEFELLSNLLTNRKLRSVGQIAALWVLLGLLNLTSAQAQTKLGLADVEAYIKNQNPEVRIAAYNQQSAEMGIRQVRSAMLPRLDLNASYNRNIRPQVFFLPATFFDPTANPNTFTSVNASAKNVYQSSLNFSVPLFQAENRPNLSQASVQSQQAATGTQQVILQKTAEARKAYLDALWAKTQEAFWEESQQRQQRLLAEMRQRLQQGLLTEADTLQAFAQAENINPQLVRVQQAYALAEQQLRLLLGLPETEVIELTDLLNFSVAVRSQNPIFENRPDLVQLKLQNEALFFQEKADQARRMPNLQLVAQYTWLSQDENFDFNRYRWINTYFVGLQLNIPIFGGFANTSRVQQTRIRQLQNQESYQFALKQAQTEWQRLRGNLTEISAQINSQEKVVQAANRAYQAIFDRWKQGLTKQTDLRQAELVLQESKLNYLGFIYQYLVLDNELKRIQGE